MEGSVGSAVPAVQGAGYGCGSLLIRRFAQVIIRPCGVVVGRGIVRVKLDGHGVVIDGILVLAKYPVIVCPVVVSHCPIRV